MTDNEQTNEGRNITAAAKIHNDDLHSISCNTLCQEKELTPHQHGELVVQPEHSDINKEEKETTSDNLNVTPQNAEEPEEIAVSNDAIIHLPREVLTSFHEGATYENKLERVLSFMQQSLAEGGAHHFREFWEARKYALQIFKESLHASSRVQLWAKYSDLCREARRMKESFDEQSAFVAEQIEIAIKAVEEEVQSIANKLSAQKQIEELTASIAIHHNIEKYSLIQNELSYLNAFATRLGSLKKELIKAEIRLKVKNKLFQHLARVGDLLFPRRKELIVTISDLFRADVEIFIQNTCIRDLKTPDLFDVREEVKRLQHIAKILTLNTEVFSTTREALSQCWDTIRDVVKERKKAQNEHKHLLRQHKDELMTELQQIRGSFEKKEIAALHAFKLVKGIIVRMKAMTLAHHDVQLLKAEIKAIDSFVTQSLDAEKSEKREKAHQEESSRIQRIEELKQTIQSEVQSFFALYEETFPLEEEITLFKSKLTDFSKQFQAFKMTKQEKAICDRLVEESMATLSRKKHQHLLELASKGNNDAQLYKLITTEISELEMQRTAIKVELDSLRKSRGASGNDITQAMLLNEHVELMKEQLTQVEASLAELRSKLNS